ncbi:MAG TPA: DUF3565 domain-containing protein [Noviherbaspirillum sp.]|jgi:hypothetical protein|uniref:DUF3565 domain-containing protein n=1 Tax=Noviherbaspirillum sp. TaxID=1926288 RepID=UPI002F94DF9C
MERSIVGFHQDGEHHWVAELDCGHNQHTRHDPPWINRPWVTTPEGRAATIGKTLRCKKCDDGAPPDRPPR